MVFANLAGRRVKKNRPGTAWAGARRTCFQDFSQRLHVGEVAPQEPWALRLDATQTPLRVQRSRCEMTSRRMYGVEWAIGRVRVGQEGTAGYG